MHTVKELAATKEASLPDLKAWLPVLQEIKNEGEHGHYQFFRRTFLGRHEGFGGRPDPWMLPTSDARYPAYQLPIDPTAYPGHPNQIKDPAAQRLAWLGNLHYWVVLNLLSLGYSTGSQDLIALSRGHMMVPFNSLARQLAKMGSGMPFDPLGQGYLNNVRSGGGPASSATFWPRPTGSRRRSAKTCRATTPWVSARPRALRWCSSSPQCAGRGRPLGPGTMGWPERQ